MPLHLTKIAYETEYRHEFFASSEYESLVDLGNTINHLIEEEGYFKRGEKVIALLGAANVDPAVFTAPLTLDLARRPNRHTGWGGGPHICLGLHLAKMETELTLSKLVERWPEMTLSIPLTWSKRIGTRGFEQMCVQLKASP